MDQDTLLVPAAGPVVGQDMQCVAAVGQDE